MCQLNYQILQVSPYGREIDIYQYFNELLGQYVCTLLVSCSQTLVWGGGSGQLPIYVVQYSCQAPCVHVMIMATMTMQAFISEDILKKTQETKASLIQRHLHPTPHEQVFWL